MIEVPTMAIPGSTAGAISDPGGDANATAKVSAKGRFSLMLLVVAVHVALGAWVFTEANELLRAAGASGNQGLVLELHQWRWFGVASIGASGLLLMVLANLVFRLAEKSWAGNLNVAKAEAEGRIRALADRLRSASADRVAAWENLERLKTELETKVNTLTASNRQLVEELDRRKRAERTMAMQSQTLAASKDVLQIHVQARSKELQKLQRQYELILNAAGEGICGVDAEGKISFVNPTAARLMGLEVDRMVGRKENEVFGEIPQGDTTICDRKAVGKQNEVTLIRTDNSTFTAEFMRSEILENERLVGRVVLFKDITERKQAAQALEQKAEELARSNAELEQFAFVASHDLQEPLRKIRAFGDRLKMKCATALPVEGADYLSRMQNAAARMQTLIADLLTFSRVISRFEPFVEVDLGCIVQEVLSDLEVRIEKVGATVEVGDLPVIEGDPTQIRQLLQNLIGNALKFQKPEVKPHVKISARINGAEDEYSPLGPTCELTVQDNGIGFDEKYLEKIFAVFQRLHNRQEYEGTGIGLAVCRRILDRHSGSITARSKPGEGATFIVQMPVKPPKKGK